MREVSQDREITYEYNADNKLSRIMSGRDDIATFSYDLFGRRIAKKEGYEEKRYIYDGLNRIAEIDGQGKVEKKFMFGSGIDEVISVENAGRNAKEYFLHDGLGSVTGVVGHSGNIKKRYSYSSFGTSAEKPEYYGFTGREYDDSSGLYYYRARYYNSKLGRFTQQDPLGMPDGMNRYIYVNNNPGNWVDPLGLKTYYINNEFGSFKPTSSPLSHSFIATTDEDPITGKEIVTDTYSWGNDSRSEWFRDDPINMEGAQKAIDTEIGVDFKGNEMLDGYVDKVYYGSKTFTSGDYNVLINNCKMQGGSLVKDAVNAMNDSMKIHNIKSDCR